MKKITATALLLCMALAAQAQWFTAMSQKTGLVLCLHLTDSNVSLYSPLQSGDPIPANKWSLHGDTLRMECSSIGFKATLARHDSTWTGTWRQGLLKEAVTFNPTDTLFQLRRPQTPQPPYRFDEETVTADYTDSQGNSVHLEGSLSIPRGMPGTHAPRLRQQSTFPCIVLVSGSGQQNRDEEIMQHKPFLVLADYLASRGIAVLRYDDRGVGKSTGALDSADTWLFAEDAEAMFLAVSANKHVDRSRLGIGGHSEGGAIAPMVAAKNKEVRFVVMMAGQGCTGLDVLLRQNDAIYRAADVSDSLLAIRTACMRALLTMPAGSSQKEYKAVIDRHTTGLSKEQTESISLGRGTAAAIKQQLGSRWMQSFLVLDPAVYLSKVQCPVLALNGSKDCQVLPRPNLDRVKTLCPQADCRELPGLNHLYQHCETGSPDEYMLIEETFSEEAMEAIADFIFQLDSAD